MNATHLRNKFMPPRGRRDDCKSNGNPELPIDRRAFRDDRRAFRDDSEEAGDAYLGVISRASLLMTTSR